MKIKVLLSSFLAVIGILCTCSLSYAYWITPPDRDMYDLDHNKAYLWGIDKELADNEVVTHAYLRFVNINDWIIEDNDILYVRLFDEAESGIQIFDDNEATGDYFAPEGTELFTWTDDNEYWSNYYHRYINPSETYTYWFSPGEITLLNSAMADGNFGFSFDPDCHFTNDKIKFGFCTEEIVTPEPATLLLFGFGLAGAGIFRRRKK